MQEFTERQLLACLATANPSADQLARLTPAQITWLTPAQIARLHAIWAGVLTPAQIARLTPEQITWLTPAQIARLTPEQIARLTPAQITWLTPAQIARLTPEQIESLTPAQIAWLTPEQIARLTPRQIERLTLEQSAIPKVERLYSCILADILASRRALDQSTFGPEHGPRDDPGSLCHTPMCIAGHTVNLAGAAGYRLKDRFGFALAAAMIHRKSRPDAPAPRYDFYPSDWALAYIEERAAEEQAMEGGE